MAHNVTGDFETGLKSQRVGSALQTDRHGADTSGDRAGVDDRQAATRLRRPHRKHRSHRCLR